MTVPPPYRNAGSAPERISRVTAVLGPTNTGKTHYAIERMLAHASGMIGLPLRLLAREVYDRVVAVKGADAAALITGEEKIVPREPAYWICTVESMPLDRPVECLAVDEIQLAADPERGHIFTDRLLHARGTHETLFLGAETIRPLLHRLLPQLHVMTRTRYSDLAYTGARKLTRLPRRTAVVAFSAEAVYGMAELLRRERGGAAVVMGALSPRTRNAQVALYQSGDVDFLVATDAIGMGLNMDVDHVAFASLVKFDGQSMRPLRPHELGQIAGRAGRYRSDGTFGVTGDAEALEPALVEQIESHRFDPVKTLQWRNAELDFDSITALIQALEMLPSTKGLQRAREADDLAALKALARDPEVTARIADPTDLRRLWEVCQVPDFRKVSLDEHVRLLGQIHHHLSGPQARLPETWIGPQIERLDVTEGEIETIAQRLAGIRVWTYVANRPGWVENQADWQDRARAVEDRLSDALHDKLTQRFIDRRTSALMKRLRAEDEFAASVADGGDCFVEGEYVGRLDGFRFIADPRAQGIHGRALRAAAVRGLQGEIAARAFRLANAPDKEITLSGHGQIWWAGSAVARLARGPAILSPRIELLADDQLTPTARARAQHRLDTWLAGLITRDLAPLLKLRAAGEGLPETLSAPVRGMAFRLAEALGSLPRADIAAEVRALTPEDRAALRALGVRFGEFSVFMPALLKPAPAHLAALLWAVGTGQADIPQPPPAGLTSLAADTSWPDAFSAAAGYRRVGTRLARLDMLERLADTIRTARAAPARPPLAAPETAPAADSDPGAQTPATPPPPGPAAPGAPQGTFAITPDMLSLLGCSQDDMDGVLKALGFRAVTDTGPDGQTVTRYRPRHRADQPRPEGRRSGPGRPRPERDGAAEGTPQPYAKGRPGPGKPKRAGRPPRRSEEAADERPQPPRREARRPPREERIDPDSPFAALAALKNLKP